MVLVLNFFNGSIEIIFPYIDYTYQYLNNILTKQKLHSIIKVNY